MHKSALLIAVVAFSLTGAMLAQEKNKSAAASVAGQWTMTVKGTSHGDLTMGLTLQQEGTRVTGTFASPHGEHSVEGEFAGGTLRLATKSGSDAPNVAFTATLNDDETLSGYLSTERGDMNWTATRVKDSK